MVHFFVGIDDFEEAVEGVAAFGAGFEAEEFDADEERFFGGGGIEVSDAAFEKERFLVGHGGELDSDELVL